MAIGLHAVVGQRKLQPQVVGEVLDEVGGDIDRLLIHRFVCAKVRFLLLWVSFFSTFVPKTNLIKP
jgi:hypothetical protein